MTLLASRVDALTQQFDKLGASPTPDHFSSSLVRVYATCEIFGV